MSDTAPPMTESPRKYADKSTKCNLLDAIRMALQIESRAVRHNTQTFNRNRYKAFLGVPDYESLKAQAREIKERSIANLPELIAKVERAVTERGGYFYLAPDAAAASAYIKDVCVAHGVRLAVKGKSMTSEEIRLNHALETAGIDVAETDLAEFILQVADEQPSHIIAPAIHYSRERITQLFKRKFKTDLPLDTGEELTKFARERLRNKFLAAEAGISGANLIAAECGTLMLVESEANIRMVTTVPPLHIAIAGIEKLVASREEFAPFIELLAASGTGQPMACYTSLLRPPLKSPLYDFAGHGKSTREFHLVLLDNGRTRMRHDPLLKDVLYCIRCSACLNSCANFQTVGGHAFGGETYSGGIGAGWEAGTSKLEHARFSELCTGCSRCVPQCPVKIDIPWLNAGLRERLNQQLPPTLVGSVLALAGPEQDRSAPSQKQFFANYHLHAARAAKFPKLANTLAGMRATRVLLEVVVGFDRRREMPPIPPKTLVQYFEDYREPRRSKLAGSVAEETTPALAKAVLFADVFTNYGSPHRGMAAVRVLEHAGIDVVVTPSVPDGRGALSQGLITTARLQAKQAADCLEHFVSEGRDIIVVEPSVLAMLRLDYRHLLEDQEQFERLRSRSYETVEYLWKVLEREQVDPTTLFSAEACGLGTRVFYHSHCQQKTVGSAAATEEMLRGIGFDLISSQVECCGMAGSFGYKKEYYDLSMAVGADLFTQIKEANAAGGDRLIIGSGTSCIEQMQSGVGKNVLHVVELLDACRRTRNT